MWVYNSGQYIFMEPFCFIFFSSEQIFFNEIYKYIFHGAYVLVKEGLNGLKLVKVVF